jgi:hypothetical protein
MNQNSVLTLIIASALAVNAQWLNYPAPGIPRSADGKPILTAPTPRASDGNPDLSGLWQMNRSDFVKFHVNLAADLKGLPLRSPGEALYKQRIDTFGVDDPSSRCLPSGVPRIHADPFAYRIIQLPALFVILYESERMYRQIFTDGRELPNDPNPTWMGYSVGRWEGEQFVVTSSGFNGKTWLDSSGHPSSDALRVIERFQRLDFGHIKMEVVVEDSKMYTRPWEFRALLELLPDSELLEYICRENEKDLSHLVGK